MSTKIETTNTDVMAMLAAMQAKLNAAEARSIAAEQSAAEAIAKADAKRKSEGKPVLLNAPNGSYEFRVAVPVGTKQTGKSPLPESTKGTPAMQFGWGRGAVYVTDKPCCLVFPTTSFRGADGSMAVNPSFALICDGVNPAIPIKSKYAAGMLAVLDNPKLTTALKSALENVLAKREADIEVNHLVHQR